MFSQKLKLFLFLFLFLIGKNYYSQIFTLNKIDSISGEFEKHGDYKRIVVYNLELVKQSKKTNNKEVLVIAYINLGRTLCTLNRYKESLYYLDKAEEQISEIKNNLLESRLYAQYGRNYYALGLFKESVKNFNKSISFAKKLKDLKNKNNLLYYNYAWKLDNFHELNLIDSMYIMQNKCIKLGPEPLLYVTIAARHLKDKIHLDSTEYYLKKALKITDNYPLYQKSRAYFIYGKFYTEKKDNESALKYYLKALDIFKKTQRQSDKRDAYKSIAETYKSLNEKEKANEYLEKYSNINDSINESEKSSLDIPIEKVIKEKENQQKNEKYQLYLIIFLIAASALITIYYIRKSYIKNQSNKVQILNEKIKETEILKNKLTISTEGVIKLAKKNDPFFLSRFQDVYPEFYEKLKTQHPLLTLKDLKICALIKLNLTSQDIVECENISLRTVETKKYRLKKKLNLSVDDDLNIWIQNL
ncbi:tetratricopeptide repeat protein [Chryseobacterium limigenitum]|uniref:Tetratricopeptide repeat-containing protein n=1 Tax=Chryseobacterium limigenitum TaxID=1612149 RepID=A0A1K2IWE1_9FLAO|nr:tetratricopeptide repeat protein [Chryseobacterium limigenitum]SFZ96687.1 Tetratricopeptide repeat-containing protein [Chryseobacterium limigenitum]